MVASTTSPFTSNTRDAFAGYGTVRSMVDQLRSSTSSLKRRKSGAKEVVERISLLGLTTRSAYGPLALIDGAAPFRST